MEIRIGNVNKEDGYRVIFNDTFEVRSLYFKQKSDAVRFYNAINNEYEEIKLTKVKDELISLNHIEKDSNIIIPDKNL